MDEAKCRALKAELSTQAEHEIVVSIERFFDGNDDADSIGCNLLDHPGIDIFRDALVGLLRRRDVQAVYARISELDPGEGYWPFTDTVFIVGTVAESELREALKSLEPDEIGSGEEFGVPDSIKAAHAGPIMAVWWD